jgi:chromosome segregation ATPase
MMAGVAGALKKAGGWLLGVVLIVPTTIALYLWGRSWRSKAQGYRKHIKTLRGAIEAAEERAKAQAEAAGRYAEQAKALEERTAKLLETIKAAEADIDAIESTAGKVNAAFGLNNAE